MAVSRRRVPTPLLAGVFLVACFLVIFVSGITRISASMFGMSKTFLVLLFSSLGAALAGPYTFRRIRNVEGKHFDALLARTAILLTFSIPLSLILILLCLKLLLLDHFLDFAVLSVVLAVPFFFTATIMISVLSRYPRESARLGLLTACGMALGSALGAVLYLFLGDVYVMTLNGVFASLAAFAFAWGRGLRKQRMSAVALTLFVTALSFFKSDISFARPEGGGAQISSGYVLLRSLYDLLPNESIFARTVSSSSVVAFLIAFLPLALLVLWRGRKSSLALERRLLLLCFTCFGIGLGVVGLSLFWEYALFVADPIWASSLVLFFLTSAMATGMCLVRKKTLAARRNAVHGTLLLIAGTLACIITLYAGPFEDIVGRWKSLPLVFRMVSTFVLLFPFGVLVGATIPLVWSLVREELATDLPQFAGSLTGTFSVGLLLALCLSLGQGFDVSLIVGQMFLLMAFVLVVLLPQSPPT